MNLTGMLPQAQRSFSEFWMARDQRERMLLGLAAVAAAGGLFYALLIDPAMTGREQLRRNLPNLRQQLAELQLLAKEAGELGGTTIPVVVISEASIKASLARQGLKPQSIALHGYQARVQLADASFAATLEWLNDMQKTARLSVVDADFAAQAQPGMVKASLILRQF